MAAQLPNPYLVSPGALSGYVAVITGATAGLGKCTAAALARAGARVIFAVRNQDKAQKVAAEIADACLRDGVTADLVYPPHVPTIDMLRCDTIRAFADAVMSQPGACVHILVNCAGASRLPNFLTVDGVSSLAAANYLGPWLLTRLLEPLLIQSGARVVQVSSITARTCAMPHPLPFLTSWRTTWYKHTKCSQVLHAYELQRRLGPMGVQVCVVDPGGVNTDIWTNTVFNVPPIKQVIHAVYAPPQDAAEIVVHAACVPWEQEEMPDLGPGQDELPRWYARGLFASPLICNVDGALAGRASRVPRWMAWGTSALFHTLADYPVRALSGGRMARAVQVVPPPPAGCDPQTASLLWELSERFTRHWTIPQALPSAGGPQPLTSPLPAVPYESLDAIAPTAMALSLAKAGGASDPSIAPAGEMASEGGARDVTSVLRDTLAPADVITAGGQSVKSGVKGQGRDEAAMGRALGVDDVMRVPDQGDAVLPGGTAALPATLFTDLSIGSAELATVPPPPGYASEDQGKAFAAMGPDTGVSPSLAGVQGAAGLPDVAAGVPRVSPDAGLGLVAGEVVVVCASEGPDDLVCVAVAQGDVGPGAGMEETAAMGQQMMMGIPPASAAPVPGEVNAEPSSGHSPEGVTLGGSAALAAGIATPPLDITGGTQVGTSPVDPGLKALAHGVVSDPQSAPLATGPLHRTSSPPAAGAAVSHGDVLSSVAAGLLRGGAVTHPDDVIGPHTPLPAPQDPFEPAPTPANSFIGSGPPLLVSSAPPGLARISTPREPGEGEEGDSPPPLEPSFSSAPPNARLGSQLLPDRTPSQIPTYLSNLGIGKSITERGLVGLPEALEGMDMPMLSPGGLDPDAARAIARAELAGEAAPSSPPRTGPLSSGAGDVGGAGSGAAASAGAPTAPPASATQSPGGAHGKKGKAKKGRHSRR